MAVLFAYVPATHDGLTVLVAKTPCWWCGAPDETDHTEAENARCLQKKAEYHQAYEEYLDSAVHAEVVLLHAASCCHMLHHIHR